MKKHYLKACKLLFQTYRALAAAGFKLPYWVECREKDKLPMPVMTFELCSEGSYVEMGSYPAEWDSQFHLLATAVIKLESNDGNLMLSTELDKIKLPKGVKIGYRSNKFPKFELGAKERIINVSIKLTDYKW